MEALADKICKEELGQEPSNENLAFRKTLVHGMVRWDTESKVKNLSSNPVLEDSSFCVVCGKKYKNPNKDSDTCYDCREPHAK